MSTTPEAEPQAQLLPSGLARFRGCGASISLCGIDGSGKTTLSDQLCVEFRNAGLDAQCLHLYQWYRALFVAPILVLANRWCGKRVLIFDRCFYDNLAVFFASRPGLRRHLPALVRAFATLSPRFDFRFQLVASLPETMQRRPDTDPSYYSLLLSLYREVAALAEYREISSSTDCLVEVVDVLDRAVEDDRA